MKTQVRIKMMKIIILTLIVFFCIPVNDDLISQSLVHAAQYDTEGNKVQPVLDPGNNLTTGMPDVLLATEARSLSRIRTGRAEEESVLLFFSFFLLCSVFLPKGRAWSAIRSISLRIQSYAMLQIQILQLRDGKKKEFFDS